MGRYFGTDGVRGRANADLTAERVFEIGRYLGYYYSRNGRNKIIIGKDTRLSSDMLESALAAGIASEGCDAYLMGYGPTPAICYLTVNEDFAVGAMISASHNPYYDNGVKIFDKDGVKLQGRPEELIEDYIDGLEKIGFARDDRIGRVVPYPEGLEHYMDHICRSWPLDLSGMKIALDCANGSASFTAEKVLTRLGACCFVMNAEPDGININTGCGSTHPEGMQEYMRSHQCDIGLTFDGDADRQIPVRPDGELMNGDFVLYVCASYLKSRGRLTNNTVVTTVMSNLGLWKALQAEGIDYATTSVGDKYVYDCMTKNGYIMGGEQSGHEIFGEYETTGDGLVTALAVLSVMKATGRGVIELCSGMKMYPQTLINVHVTDKGAVMGDPEVQEAIARAEEELRGEGRILVRPSGTEPVLRVMAEAASDEACRTQCERIVEVIKRKFGV